MRVSRLYILVLSLMIAALLALALAACDTGDDSCCVGHVRGCVDDLDICAWQCNEQSAGADCYATCVDAVDECAMTCEDQ